MKRWGALLITSFICFYIIGCQKPAIEKPNILFIVADDLGYEKLGCYGGINTNTPNIDQLAKNGVQFMRAYTSPVCTPSRMSIYTGRYATKHQYTNVLPVHLGTKEFVDFATIPTYAQELRKHVLFLTLQLLFEQHYL